MVQGQQEHALKMQEMQTKHDIAMQKHQMDLEKLAMQAATARETAQSKQVKSNAKST
jgi:hypothetical protein